MTFAPATLLLSLAVLSPLPAVEAASAQPVGAKLLLAQTGDTVGAPSPSAPATGAGAAPPGAAQLTPTPSPTPAGVPATASAPPASNAAGTAPGPSAITGPTRNGAPATLPTLAQPNTATATPGASSIPFGSPQVDVQPVYGSALRDNGSGNGGIPTYNSQLGTFGGPINGTANPYYATLPNGAALPGQTTTNGRGTQVPTGITSATQQPLGGSAYTRDQNGNLGGQGGYNVQGVYNGTAAQTGNGYGSAYANNGRPIGGLLSTGVDATGPLRPYIPLNNGTIGRPNSGYGVPNGSQPTHMDARGIQRVN